MSNPKPAEPTAIEREQLRILHATWPLSILPDAWKPYAELIRITKPAGVIVCYLPYLYGTLVIGALGYSPGALALLLLNGKLLLLSFLLGCVFRTWNDILDQDIDRQVARTRIRPLARGAITTHGALIFLAVQVALLWAFYRWQLPRECLLYNAPFLVLHVLYPFAKRFTNFPQIVLGFAFAGGVFTSFPALGQNLNWQYDDKSTSALSLGLATIFWTLLYDTIYAAQDLKDDKRIGVGSTMVSWETHAKTFLRALAVLTAGSLLGVSYTLAVTRASPVAGIVYTLLTCGGAGISLWSMVDKVKLEDSASCTWFFNTGNMWIGTTIASGLLGAYLVQA